MIKLLTTFIGFCLFSCAQQAPHVKAGQTFIKNYSSKVRQSKGWILIGSGGGFYNDINKLSFHFSTFDRTDITGARIMIVDAIENLLKAINSNPSLLPYLHETPFPIKDIVLGVGFHKLNPIGEHLEAPFIAYVFIEDGEIAYTIKKPESSALKIIHRETYEEAYRIVHGCDVVKSAQP